MIFKRIVLSVTAVAFLFSSVTSCTWRQFTGATGATVGVFLAAAWINGENQERKEKGVRELTDEEKNQITVTALAIGYALGAELGGAIGDYVAKKREEYRTETEYLNAQIYGVNKSISKADAELEWLNQQSSEIIKQADNVRKLPGARKKAAAKLQKSAQKRKKDVEKLGKHLRDARADTLQAYNSTRDQEKKKQLKANLKALDARISATRKVRDNILAANNAVSYL